MISTKDLSGMPDLRGFRKLTRSFAMLDSILSPEWEYRYYSFSSTWAPGEMMASMRDGCGDHWFALLSKLGIGLVGLAHEAPMYRFGNPWPGIFASIPSAFADVVEEPAFDSSNATFFIWRGVDDTSWRAGPVEYPAGDDPDGSKGLLAILDGKPNTYRDWAEEYYEHEVDLTAVRAVYDHEPLTEELIRTLNPDLALSLLDEDIREIGYPDTD